MWVGFPFFFAGGRKKQNKFPSNLHCPVKKLNPLLFFKLLLSYLSARLSFLHLLPTDSYIRRGTCVAPAAGDMTVYSVLYACYFLSYYNLDALTISKLAKELGYKYDNFLTKTTYNFI